MNVHSVFWCMSLSQTNTYHTPIGICIPFHCTQFHDKIAIAYILLLPTLYSTLVGTHSWLVHTPGWYTLLVGTHSWLVHAPGWYILLVSTLSWLVHTPCWYILLGGTHSWLVYTPG